MRFEARIECIRLQQAQRAGEFLHRVGIFLPKALGRTKKTGMREEGSSHSRILRIISSMLADCVVSLLIAFRLSSTSCNNCSLRSSRRRPCRMRMSSSRSSWLNESARSTTSAKVFMLKVYIIRPALQSPALKLQIPHAEVTALHLNSQTIGASPSPPQLRHRRMRQQHIRITLHRDKIMPAKTFALLIGPQQLLRRFQ